MIIDIDCMEETAGGKIIDRRHKMGIKKIMQAVQKAVNGNDERLLIQRDGYLLRSISTVNPPAEEEVIAKFERQIGHQLPKDYRLFLQEYNGAHIYQAILDIGVVAGGGLKIFSVQEMKESLNYMDGDFDFLPIGDVDQQHLAISIEAIQKKDPNYLFLMEHIDGPRPLGLNLLLFLDRFIVSQGANFWDWPLVNATNVRYSDDE